uniref:ABC transporter ATP-binding protein n=1 Tax=Candidatus Fimivicinus sp. TaxID=3056640 RepID=UPI003FF01E51
SELKKYYGAEPTLTKALDGVSLEIEQGEFAAIVGSSGSGKTTLLNMLGALDRPDSGTVTIDGSELTQMSEEERTVFRRQKIGFVFQNYNLVPILSVYENIVLPLELDGQSPQEDWIGQIVDALGLSGKANAMPNTLSGGQQQRVAIARALAARPSLILADEPTGNLDSKTGRDVM